MCYTALVAQGLKFDEVNYQKSWQDYVFFNSWLDLLS